MTRSAASASSALVMDLLQRHVPLLLLLDLADPYGPHSSELFDEEGPRGLVKRAAWDPSRGLSGPAPAQAPGARCPARA